MNEKKVNNTTLTGRAADHLTVAIPALKNVPAARMESKVKDTAVGFGVALFGAALTGAGIWLFREKDSVWTLAISGVGVLLAIVGGINMSKELAGSFTSAAATVGALVRAFKGQQGATP